jgi:MerR family transcriptional regulator, repressor of the yfmOP operon
MAATRETLRIGGLARAAGTTPRTIRYYEEIGLLGEGGARPAGTHRVYTLEDAERVRELLRLKSLLGVSLDELKEIAEAESARAALREEFERIEDPDRRREIAGEALMHVERQLALVERRRTELERLYEELDAKRERLRAYSP